MKIGLDLDNTITAYPSFFRLFTKAMKKAKGHKIYIITNRDSETKKQIKKELEKIGIRYDYIKITEDKAQYILDENIEVYFDDTDEYLLELPAKIAVFKIREPGNFSFIHKKWYYSDRTGRKIV